MPVYEYTALDRAGKNVVGIIDADSTVAARQKLRASGKYPVQIKETTAKAKSESAAGFSLPSLFNRITPDDIHALTRQLATLLNAGIPLVGALDALMEQTTSPPLKKIIAQIKESVNEGNSLTVSLTRHPKLFSNIYINMVRAGEASGSLDVVLERLAEFGEHQQALKGRFQAALVYPVFMAIIGTGVLFFLLSFVVPNLTRIFTEMKQVLPLPTTILIWFSDFMRSYWWAILVVIVASIIGIKEFIKSPKGRHIWDTLKLHLPVIGQINRKIALSRFGRTLGSLLQSGVPLITSLQIVRNIVNNVLIGAVIDEAMEDIQAGKSLNLALSRSIWFPPVFRQMVSVGEQSGDLEGMLHKVADSYEREVETRITGMTALIEPIMILFMAAIVGFIVISILLPIFEMNQMIN
ncbi:MAG: type II secretion system inner membrane protein GspF [Desulfobulbaceae bacterium]|jgi:general secretion pathway protein F|nr:type II secretion system inner membrane protein GspF [Desulfobulbaceae bacterium]MDH3782580.1 type II secretion system inner membrane protein GspF [Desulfobulbaceae bacterium]MDH3922375.1 type II secretion system inner membrane protein GspF [Desulfobulbaceae bacterium]HKJ14543.1 type II secretion system inner membrane protein GspF [Desulfobulbales bacterium]